MDTLRGDLAWEREEKTSKGCLNIKYEPFSESEAEAEAEAEKGVRS